MPQLPKIVLVGPPNVGKSALFNVLTGTYVTVSNYPGTTVDISQGKCRIQNRTFELIDTPGTYSLLPLSDEEKVTRQFLFSEKPAMVVQVIDAKNIRRMLAMTLALIDAGLPVVLDLNIMDEAQQAGVLINIPILEDILGIPVVATSALKRWGLDDLKKAIVRHQYKTPLALKFSDQIENAIELIDSLLTAEYGVSKRMIALLLLQQDGEMLPRITAEKNYEQIAKCVNDLVGQFSYSLDYVLAMERQEMVDKILQTTVREGRVHSHGFRETIGDWTRNPWTGIPVLCLVLYYGLYQFVGNFGAGFLVDYIDTNIFGQYLSPFIESIVTQYVPFHWAQSLLIGEYGIFTLGFRYAVAIILPIVGTFFFMFAILEDCGYLPRLAMLMDRIFQYIGLNGRAVIPLTLGLGCGTMATVVTRTLETKRERLLATFLLTLTIPCSAQLGLVLALLSRNSLTLVLWAAYILGIFVIAGLLGERLLPGERSPFYLEIPPLRIPVMSNVFMKAYTRMMWYFVEITPVFILTSIFLWLGERSGILQGMIYYLQPFMSFLGLPPETAQVFLFGFFRRDYGAAGLYDMSLNGMLNDYQLLVAATTLTLFVPCIAQLVVLLKERGFSVAMLILLCVILTAFFSGWMMNQIISLLGLI
ncbi:ferrous iron transport protein b c terminus [Lucifera butyrica]|uniref:Ferrous iron transport protein B n=1 Tax=Lucifera butyrica TaxID=1351585 RepID=A0A498R7J0_9FIRM|nr:ferrous iron transport protein B [Lucifera butyrica]VBB06232.1 ferrous iron transport protein b c terminus [Lucifera butyrica]